MRGLSRPAFPHNSLDVKHPERLEGPGKAS